MAKHNSKKQKNYALTKKKVCYDRGLVEVDFGFIVFRAADTIADI